MRQSLLLSMVAVLATAAACTQASEDESTSSESELNELTTPRRGNAINSSFVDPDATYWGARAMDVLTKVGAFADPVELTVAKRADGIIASRPANGLIGIDELVELEKRSATLFPEERAVLPRIWKLLEIPKATKVDAVKAELSIVGRIDDYVTKPVQIPVKSTVERVARRIELTADSDGDPSTISGADVAHAQFDRGSYLPEEAAEFRKIVRDIIPHLTPIPADAQHVAVKATPDTGAVVFESPDVKITLGNTAGPWNWIPRKAREPSIGYTPSLTLRRKSNDVRIVTLDLRTGEEKLADELPLETGIVALESGKQVEVWRAGFRVALEASTVARAELPFPAGYAVKIGDGPMLVPEYTDKSGSVIGSEWFVSWQEKASSRPGIPSGSYIIDTRPGARVDVFENGRVVLIDAKGIRQECAGPTKPMQKEVLVCRLQDNAGSRSMLYLSPQTKDTPAVGYFDNGDGRTGDLYPY